MTKLELLQADMHLAKWSKDNALAHLRCVLNRVTEAGWLSEQNKWVVTASHESVTRCILEGNIEGAKELADCIGAYKAKRLRHAKAVSDYRTAKSDYRAKKANK